MMDRPQAPTRKVQLKELEILKAFQDICRRHNLRYFAVYGTCLGAVRHKGFIPWDDDVDVAMPYEDYIKFLEIAQSELPEGYETFDPINNKGNLFEYFAKVHDVNTAMIEGPYLRQKSTDRYWGIYIDVFVVNGLPNSQKEINRLNRGIRFYARLSKRLRLQFKDTLRSFKQIFVFILCSPLRLLKLPFNYFTKKSYELISKYPVGCSNKIVFPWRSPERNASGWYTNIFPYSDFEHTVELPFEDTTIAVPQGYDHYLTMEFGDYMTPPPENRRGNHASWGGGGISDLEHSYKYYAALKESGKHW